MPVVEAVSHDQHVGPRQGILEAIAVEKPQASLQPERSDVVVEYWPDRGQVEAAADDIPEWK